MIWEVEPDEDVWSLQRTSLGRGLDGLRWGLFGGGITFAIAALYFGIDWVGRAATGVEVTPLFWASVGLFAGFGAFLGFVARMLRFKHWVIDPVGRHLSLVTRRVFADPQGIDVSFDEIAKVVVSRTEVTAWFNDGTREVLAGTLVGGLGLGGVAAGLARAFEGTDVELVLPD